MRIALITPEYPPTAGAGGIATNTAVVARALVGLGHDVAVFTRGDGSRAKEDGVDVLRLRQRWLPTRLGARLRSTRAVARATLSFQPDVVQASEWEGEAWWLARWTRVALITRLATPTYLIEELNLGRPSRRTAVLRRLERDQTRRSAAVIAISRAIGERVGRDWALDEGRMHLVPNAVEIDRVRRAGRADAPVELPERFLAFVGRLERRKGVDVFAAALPRVLAAHPELHAVFVGAETGGYGGAVTADVIASVEPVRARVHFLGELSRELVFAVAARAEIVCLPSLWEAFGNAALEAMALGRPLVVTSTGGFVDFVDDGRTGWLVPPGDVEALSDRLLACLSEPESLRRVGEHAARRAEDFDAPVIVGRLLEVYEAVLSEKRPFRRSVYGGGYRRYFKPDEARNPFHRLYEAKRRAVLDRLAAQPRFRILDVGGGYGRYAGPLSRYHDVTLCDVSADMLAEAQARWGSSLEVVQADAQDLPFPEASFDAVLAIDLLPHLPDLGEGLAALVRVARTGGTVIMDTSNASPWWVLAYPGYVNWRPRRLLATMRRRGVLPEWSEIIRHDREREVRRAIGAAGLRVYDVESFGPFWSAKWHLWWTTKL